jgi:hypothetical protein
VIELNTVSATSFKVASLNGSFEDTTATITTLSQVVGTMTIKNAKGARDYDFRLSVSGYIGQPSYCQEFSLTQPPLGANLPVLEWEPGPSRVPPQQPCNTVFEGVTECHDAWSTIVRGAHRATSHTIFASLQKKCII